MTEFSTNKTLNLISSELKSFSILVERAKMSELAKTAYDEEDGTRWVRRKVVMRLGVSCLIRDREYFFADFNF
jgi:hypothetical protein